MQQRKRYPSVGSAVRNRQRAVSPPRPLVRPQQFSATPLAMQPGVGLTPPPGMMPHPPNSQGPYAYVPPSPPFVAPMIPSQPDAANKAAPEPKPIETESSGDNNITDNTNANGGVGQPPAPRVPAGMSEAFLVIYKLCVIFGGVIFGGMVLFGLYDVILYFKNEIVQKIQRTRDPLMFNKDTTDIKALSYVQTNKIDEEMYSIYQQQRLVGYLFVVAGIMTIMLGVQIGTFFSLKLYALFTQSEFKDRVEVPTKMLGTMVVLVIAGLVIKSLYKKHFVRKVQGSLRDLRSQLRDVRTFVFNNLTTNATFLAALRTDNIDDVIDTIVTMLQSRTADTCNDKMAPCDGDVESMMFSLNLYSYLKMQVPESDPNYDKISRMFDPDGVNARDVDPTMYFYYKQSTYVPNLYPIMRTRIKKYFGEPTGKKAPADFKLNPVRERIFLVNLNNKMQELNAKLSRMYNITSGKNKVRGYILTYTFYVIMFATVLVGMYYQEAKPYIQIAKDAIKRVFSRGAANATATS